jgi:hypothetical protein
MLRWGWGVLQSPRVTAKAGGKSLDSTVGRRIIVAGCSGTRKGIKADRDTEAPVTREIVMPLGEIVSDWETVSEVGLGLPGHKGLENGFLGR